MAGVGASGAVVCVPEAADDVEATAVDAFAGGVTVDGVAAADTGLDGADEVATSES